jgi:hypothetical protein
LDYSLATATALRCAGVPAVFTRYGTHSDVHFYHNGCRFKVVPGHIGTDSNLKIMPVTPKSMEKPSGLDKRNLYLEGLDPQDVGMHSILDFWIARKSIGSHIAREMLIKFYGETLKKEGLLPG